MLDLKKLENELKPGSFSLYDMEAILPELQKLKAGDVYLEVGVDRGRSLDFARTVANPMVKIYGVDLRKDPKVKGTTFMRGDSSTVALSFKDQINLLFIDGDHSYSGCKADIMSWAPHLSKDAVVFFHDCDETSPGVVQAVAEWVNDLKDVKKWEMFKRTDKNTSMSGVWL